MFTSQDKQRVPIPLEISRCELSGPHEVTVSFSIRIITRKFEVKDCHTIAYYYQSSCCFRDFPHSSIDVRDPAQRNGRVQIVNRACCNRTHPSASVVFEEEGRVEGRVIEIYSNKFPNLIFCGFYFYCLIKCQGIMLFLCRSNPP